MYKKPLNYINSFSKVTYLLLLVVMLWTTFNLKRWKKAETSGKLITWDVTSYYGYLPAAFIHNDLSLDFIDTDGIDYAGKHQFWPERLNKDLERDPKGEIKVIKTTMGMSFMYAPFFFLAHGFAHISKYEPNGFSQPYEFFLVVSCLFYLFIGLFYLRKILLRNFSETVTGTTLITVLLATNLFYYCSEEPAMSHAYNFSLIICFVYHSINWLEKQSIKRAIYIGLLGGLIVLIRPVNILIFLFPLFYAVNNFKSFMERIQLIYAKGIQILILASCSFLVILPQLIYWKLITGFWLFNSYVGERFYFGNNHILEGLFSYRKGWLVYTPIMIFSIIGLGFLYKKRREYFLPITSLLVLNIIILYSWWSWWYGGSFGSRPMIDSYGLLAIPIASFYAYIFKRKYLAIPVIFLSVLFLSLNLFQTHQRRRNLIHWDAMTKEAYWNVFLKSRLTAHEWELQEKYIKAPDYDKALRGEDEYTFNPF